MELKVKTLNFGDLNGEEEGDHDIGGLDPHLVEKARRVIREQERACRAAKERIQKAEEEKLFREQEEELLRQARRRSMNRGGMTRDGTPGHFPSYSQPAKEGGAPQPIPARAASGVRPPRAAAAAAGAPGAAAAGAGAATAGAARGGGGRGGGVPSRSPPPNQAGAERSSFATIGEGTLASARSAGTHLTARSQRSVMESIRAVRAPRPEPAGHPPCPTDEQLARMESASQRELAEAAGEADLLLYTPEGEAERQLASLRSLADIMDTSAQQRHSQSAGGGGGGAGKKGKAAPHYAVLPSLSRGGAAARNRLPEAGAARAEHRLRRRKAAEKKARMVFQGDEHAHHKRAQTKEVAAAVATAEELTVLKCIMIREQVLLTLQGLLRRLELDYHRHQHYKRKKVKHHAAARRGPAWQRRESHLDQRARRIGVEVHLRQRELKALLAQLRAASLDTAEAVQAWRKAHGRAKRARVYGAAQAQLPDEALTFRWRGANYLLKMRRDQDFLDHFACVEAWVGFPLAGNPLLAPPEPFEWVEELARLKEELGQRLKAKRALRMQKRAEEIRAKMQGAQEDKEMPGDPEDDRRGSRKGSRRRSRRASSTREMPEEQLAAHLAALAARGSAPASPRGRGGGGGSRRSSLERALRTGGVDAFRKLATPRGEEEDGPGGGGGGGGGGEGGSRAGSLSLGGTQSLTEGGSAGGGGKEEQEEEADDTEESELSSGMEEVVCFPDLVPEEQLVAAFPPELRRRVERVERILAAEGCVEARELREAGERAGRREASLALLRRYRAQEGEGGGGGGGGGGDGCGGGGRLLLDDNQAEEFRRSLRRLQQEPGARAAAAAPGGGGRDAAAAAAAAAAAFLTELARQDSVLSAGAAPRAAKFNKAKLVQRMDEQKEAARRLKVVASHSAGAAPDGGGGRRRPKAIRGTMIVQANFHHRHTQKRAAAAGGATAERAAAIHIQRVARGFRGRRRAERQRRRRRAGHLRDGSARTIQRVFRGYAGRLDFRARRAAAHGSALRRANLERRRDRAARLLQRFFRNLVVEAQEYRGRQYLTSNSKAIAEGAQKIQRLYRLLLKSRVRRRRAAHRTHVAAAAVQRAWRAHAARRRGEARRAAAAGGRASSSPPPPRRRRRGSSASRPSTGRDTDSKVSAGTVDESQELPTFAPPGMVRLQAVARGRRARAAAAAAGGEARRRAAAAEDRRRRGEAALRAAKLAVRAAQAAAAASEDAASRAGGTRLPSLLSGRTSAASSSLASYANNSQQQQKRSRHIQKLPQIKKKKQGGRDNHHGTRKEKKLPVQINVLNF